MGIPTTFAGLLGFILLSGYLIGDIMDGNRNSDNVENSVQTLQQNINESMGNTDGGLTGYYSVLGGIIMFGWSMVETAISAISAFLMIPLQRDLPAEMYIVFSIIVLSLMAAAVKWIWSGE